MRSRIPAVIVFSLIPMIEAWAQNPAGEIKPPLAFEVASIKRSVDRPLGEMIASGRIGPITEGDRHSILFMPLSITIAQAYGVRGIDVMGPAWLKDDKFAIVTKMPACAAKEIPAMLRTLLAERFHLQIHRETRQSAAYVVGIAKSGLKLPELSADEPLPPRRQNAEVMEMSGELAPMLPAIGTAAGLDAPMIDETGTKGRRFRVAVPTRKFFANRFDANADGKVDPLTILREAFDPLGLTVERRQVPTEVIVVDQIDRNPTEN